MANINLKNEERQNSGETAKEGGSSPMHVLLSHTLSQRIRTGAEKTLEKVVGMRDPQLGRIFEEPELKFVEAVHNPEYPNNAQCYLEVWGGSQKRPLVTFGGEGTTEEEARDDACWQAIEFIYVFETASWGTLVEMTEPMTPQLFVELMAQFFRHGWVLGSSGGMAASVANDGAVLVSPSSVPKERIKESELFLIADPLKNDAGPLVIRGPDHLRLSACTPLFLLLIRSTPRCRCVIHTHSKYANLIASHKIYNNENKLTIRDQEMLKGTFNRQTWEALRNTDTLTIPIIENAPEEQELLPAMRIALDAFPESPVVLVRRHGLFVWGPSWQKTKVMLECIEYLLEMGFEMCRMGIPLS